MLRCCASLIGVQNTWLSDPIPLPGPKSDGDSGAGGENGGEYGTSPYSSGDGDGDGGGDDGGADGGMSSADGEMCMA